MEIQTQANVEELGPNMLNFSNDNIIYLYLYLPLTFCCSTPRTSSCCVATTSVPPSTGYTDSTMSVRHFWTVNSWIISFNYEYVDGFYDENKSFPFHIMAPITQFPSQLEWWCIDPFVVQPYSFWVSLYYLGVDLLNYFLYKAATKTMLRNWSNWAARSSLQYCLLHCPPPPNSMPKLYPTLRQNGTAATEIHRSMFYDFCTVLMLITTTLELC